MEGRTRFVAISGMAGTGKSTVAEALSQYLGWSMFSAGQTMREILSRQPNKYKCPAEFDAAVDAMARKFVLDHQWGVVEGRLSLLATREISRVFSVLLTCEAETRYRRIFDGRHRGETTLDRVRFDTARRDQEDLERLSQKFPDPYNPAKYNLHLDTTHLSREEVFELVLAGAGFQSPAVVAQAL